ncbi:unnamed protein product [Paramecium primaurelia]|uniref:Uncharacterized protein n=1 Tax=Paramecium primaurelia TaxID=5886 RepID=A0A8S1QMA3_PARPR|nr:unnamed protein product [Paramecium primaurelia]
MSNNVKNIANNSNFVVSNNNHQQNVNYHYQQQQQQQKQFNQQEEQALILFYIYEDFQNFLNLLYQFIIVKEQFKTDPQNILVSICENKLITQMNLSNSIHYDLSKNQKNSDLISFLKKNKNDIKKNIRSVCPTKCDKEIDKYIQYYENICLSENVQIYNMELIPTQLKVNFNEEVLQKIFPQIQAKYNNSTKEDKPKITNLPRLYQIKSNSYQYQQDTFLKTENLKFQQVKKREFIN